jgi:hypothetical protein
MAVITVSRQLGSLGTEMAQKVAEVLQYEFVDKEKIGKALATYGLPEPDLEKFDEKNPLYGIPCRCKEENSSISSRPCSPTLPGKETSSW